MGAVSLASDRSRPKDLKIYHAEAGQPKFYVHPDTLHLLEPQDGDGVEFDRWHWERKRNRWGSSPQAHFGKVRIGSSWKSVTSLGVGWDEVERDKPFALPLKIIQRNGIPFHWPEQEP